MIDPQETRRAIAAIGIVGQIDGHDVIRRTSVLELLQHREPEIERELAEARARDAQMMTALRKAAEGYRSERITGLPCQPIWRERTLAAIDAAMQGKP